MGTRRRSSLLFALLMAVMLVAAACSGGGGGGGGGGGEATGQPQVGGTLIFGAEQEPSEGLNGDLTCCTLFWQSVILNPVLAGALQTRPDFTYAPNIVEDLPEVGSNPFSLTYKVRDEAEWNDGEPITAQDLVFTAETNLNPKFDIASRAGYDQMDLSKTEIIDEKTVKFVFKQPYSGWRELFNPILPEHSLKGEDYDKVWTNEIVDPKTGKPIASGPFQFDSYDKGTQLTIVRNENYWGPHKAYLDEIVFQFVPETTTEIESLRAGEVDAIYPQPQLELVPLLNTPGLQVQSNAGTTWEHVDMQFANPLLKDENIRKAFAYAVDRQKIVDQLFKDLLPSLEPLQNMIFLQNSEFYEPHFQEYTYDPEKSKQLLEEAGCTPGNGGIYECNGQPLQLGFKSTADNRLMELAYEIIQQDARKAGFDLQSQFGDAAVVFGNQGLAGGKYDLFMFAWVGNPDPGGSVEIHKCKGTQNFQNYCNQKVTDLLEKSDTTVDPAERADLMNQADALMSQDMPILPLYQKPTFFAFSDKLQNAEDSPTQDGPTWNAQDWWISDSGQ